MKNVRVSQDIVPMGVFKTHASRLLKEVNQSGRPLVVTQNGRPTAVVITPREFDRLVERQEFIRAVEEGLSDSAAGRVVEDTDLERELNEKFGPLGD
jgi:prevent-host-death family protein